MLKKLKIGICQMNVVPGEPEINAKNLISDIEKAEKDGIELLIAPELCLSGYLIADMFEDDAFIQDVIFWNKKIQRATKGKKLGVIFGSITIEPNKTGEDGRLRKFNSALFIQNGKLLKRSNKSLLPKYRIFDDARHFFSLRQTRDEDNELFRTSQGKRGDPTDSIHDYLTPVPFQTKNGVIKIGLLICEEIWDKDYVFKPAKSLVEHGAELLVSISASPRTWQKNRKRHSVIKELLETCKVPLIYVNNTGLQNTGKNFVIFDGDSTMYNADGKIVANTPLYTNGLFKIRYSRKMREIEKPAEDDTTELYQAVNYGIIQAFKALPPHLRKVHIGVSGGIDSALSLALHVNALGKENVFAYYMPGQFSSEDSFENFQKLVKNFGVQSEVIPISDIVLATAIATNVNHDSPAHENIMARARMEILAAKAQDLGGVFTCNSNKVEIAFGYGTIYGDIAGFYCPLGDLVKREVYQLANYLNRKVFRFDMIPESCFFIAPSAENLKNQKDPFDYGSLLRRGYHDELVRAFTEFRRNPEWVVEKFISQNLETEMKLNPGWLDILFPTAQDFVQDLELQWGRLHGACFKRVQSPPILIVSKRSFGNDLREAILGSHLTRRYNSLKRKLLADSVEKRRIAIYGGSFNPVARHHREILELLLAHFDLVIVVPCGLRPDKPTTNEINPLHRKNMLLFDFSNIERVLIDTSDIDNSAYSPTYILHKRYKKQYPGDEIWHVVGGDIITHGSDGKSEIKRFWHRGNEIWEKLNFLVLERPGYRIKQQDMPPHSEMLSTTGIVGSSTIVRERIANGKPIDQFVSRAVEKYIKKNKIYK